MKNKRSGEGKTKTHSRLKIWQAGASNVTKRIQTQAPEKKTPQKTNKSVSAKKKPAVKKKAVKKAKVTPAAVKQTRKINCMLPGADLLAEGNSVSEVMAALGKEKESSLSVEEERFCQEYVSCNIAVRAALRVWPDLSYDYASTKAERLMKNDEIKQRVSEITEEHKERYGLTESKVLKRLAALVFFDRRTLYKADGSMKAVHELTEEEAAAVTEIESKEIYAGTGEDRIAIGLIHKAKFADPKAAIELAGKKLKLWNDVGSKNNPLTLNPIKDLLDLVDGAAKGFVKE